MKHPDTMTWWGTATCTYELGGIRILTDPVLDPAGTAFAVEPPLSPPLHYRSRLASAASEEALAGMDLVLLSHDHHGDNFDARGRHVARTARTVLTTRAGAARLRDEDFAHVVGLDPWERWEGDGLRIIATPARHAPLGGNWFVGPVLGFVIERPGHGRIWISGDTRYFGGVARIARRVGPIETCVLHLGAARFGPRMLRRWLRFSMDAADAVRTVSALAPRSVVPVHFDGWSHFTEDRAAASQIFARHGIADRVRWPARGEQLALG